MSDFHFKHYDMLHIILCYTTNTNNNNMVARTTIILLSWLSMKYINSMQRITYTQQSYIAGNEKSSNRHNYYHCFEYYFILAVVDFVKKIPE